MGKLTIALLLVLASNVIADSWPAAKANGAISDNAEWLVRVEPGESMGDVFGFAGSPTGRYAEATLYRFDDDLETFAKVREYQTKNPVAPVDILVTNEGWLIALDNWHNFGIGTVVAAYDSDGGLVRELNLADIFSPDELKLLDQSVSSIWWRCGPAVLDPVEDYFGVWDALGRAIRINFVDGTVKVIGKSDVCVDDDT
jgi:hypothetical protein